MSAVRTTVTTEVRLFLRDPVAAGFAPIFPALLMVLIGLIPLGDEDFGGRALIDIYAPIAISMGVAMTALVSLPTFMATYREQGVLRRLSATPARPSVVLAAQAAVNCGAAAVSIILVHLVGGLAFGLSAPGTLVGYLLVLVLGIGCLMSLGLVSAALCSNGRVASGVGNALFFPMAFFAGTWTPGPAMPDLVRAISDFVPLGALVQALDATVVGEWPSPLHVGVLIGWTVLGSVVAARFFRWA
ncbi:ABC transporter permease [Actinoalloteichus sp. AHMU CJ021]|uniref:ABC-2 type transport system permease protein n=1 Tax=Actinoalloteichus caeruleus DSM 43889 TaxID=1120930 RepID=A0ABT1JIW2_ACTCY|nr:ABC transporter permease [Actinoalloteichus caeruleus]AUS78364.1 ABC transporter permease [Actinoalloteichus sp. AHMU CJ021]MCP2332442.1 ABC-2 type transport system permease protein [Actinoalloteichus caeruleus DSM 43889]